MWPVLKPVLFLCVCVCVSTLLFTLSSVQRSLSEEEYIAELGAMQRSSFAGNGENICKSAERAL